MASIIEGLGILALLALAFSTILRRSTSPRQQQWLIRGMFVVSTVFVMYTPFEVAPGIVVDARHIVLGLAAPFGGVLTALAAAASSIIIRVYTGGVGTQAGIAGICISVSAGIFFRLVVQPRILEIRVRHLIFLASIVSLTLLSLLFIPKELRLGILLTAGVAIIGTNFIGVIFLGSFLSHEKNRISREETSVRNAQIDPLTKLYNRRGYNEEAEKAIKLAQFKNLPSATMVLDFDHFKSINDRYGHKAGDAVLAWVSDLIRKTVRPDDISARFGGDEFIVLLPGVSEAQATVIAERLRSEVAAADIIVDGQKIKTTVSIGVSEMPSAGATSSYSFHAADAALFRAKSAGRNKVKV